MRPSRFELRAGVALLLFTCSVSPGVGPARFTCPPGTRAQKGPHLSEPVQVELCRDLKTSLREGPYRWIAKNGLVKEEGSYRADKHHGEIRVYDDQGRLTHVNQYSNGELLSSRMTRVGMENMFGALNEKFRKKGHKMKFAVVDEQTVEFTTVTSTRFNQPARDEMVVRERVIAEGSVCNAFRTVGNMQTYIARYVDEGSKTVLVVPIRRADCTR